jgi:hypothetical protein
VLGSIVNIRKEDSEKIDKNILLNLLRKEKEFQFKLLTQQAKSLHQVPKN